MPEISLYAYWAKWVRFNLSSKELALLKRYIVSERDDVIDLGGWSFRLLAGYLHFSNGGDTDKYYIDMPLSEIISVIDKAVTKRG